jgi:hypothetical protein
MPAGLVFGAGLRQELTTKATTPVEKTKLLAMKDPPSQ